MSGNSLANNNAVRLGAAALVGGLVVYLIWSATSSSSTPRSPPTSPSSTLTTTTTTTTTTTSSSKAGKKSTSKRSESKSEEEEKRQRQSVDIDRTEVPKAIEPPTTIPSVPEDREEKGEDEDDVVVVDKSVVEDLTESFVLVAEHSHKEIETTEEVKTISVKELSTQSTASFVEEKQEIHEHLENQHVETTEVAVEATEEQVETKEQVEEPEVPVEEAEATVEEPEAPVENQPTVIPTQVEEEIKEEILEREIETPAVYNSLISQSDEFEHVEEEEKTIEQEETMERVEEAIATSDSPFSYSNVETSRTTTSSAMSLESVVMPTVIETSSARTSHHALNTKAAIFTPSWMPVATHAASFDSRSSFLAAPTQDLSYQWALNGSVPMAQSQPQLNENVQQENGRVKMKSRCRFWPNCTNKACKFTHPSLPCRDPDNCTFGDRCNFIHPKDLNRKPSRSGNKSNPSRKESRRQNQSGAIGSMASSIDSLGLSASGTTAVGNGNPWDHS
ncbi:hypothetical protein BGZ80_002292 [Entomortierella chlamydospora]|uniref:C3H1-type domain-containing protein n=1 Tax=Entomortierella chlamydospora TaxID=101097 RepID=A0A9P6MQB2_9FUNG|nr:hypothetical protein BGZ79_001797 [Entomortierella chlamydospora]KAG0009536.1 hypothetical protein BGZ80_002292 [Entomortierella chlamydospora]